MTNRSSSLAAVAGLVAIAPAACFMTALVARNLPQPQPARVAALVVTWYSERMWTLWLLLLALPMTAFAGGWAALAQGWRPRFVFVVTALIAAVILAIVVLHMAAN